MRFHDDSELDRALLTLPLEEAPAGLRASILAGTVYEPAVPFKAWEICVIGALLALMAWFTVMIVSNGADGFIRTLAVISDTVHSALGDSQALLWIALGTSATIWISILNLMSLRGGDRLQRR